MRRRARPDALAADPPSVETSRARRRRERRQTKNDNDSENETNNNGNELTLSTKYILLFDTISTVPPQLCNRYCSNKHTLG
jgi:hypothetical protein